MKHFNTRCMKRDEQRHTKVFNHPRNWNPFLGQGCREKRLGACVEDRRKGGSHDDSINRSVPVTSNSFKHFIIYNFNEKEIAEITRRNSFTTEKMLKWFKHPSPTRKKKPWEVIEKEFSIKVSQRRRSKSYLLVIAEHFMLNRFRGKNFSAWLNRNKTSHSARN